MNPPRRDDDEPAPWGLSDSTHVRALADRIWQLSQQLAVSDERIKNMSEKVDELENDVRTLTTSAHRWKGGVAVIFALGTIAGAFLNFFIKFWNGR